MSWVWLVWGAVRADAVPVELVLQGRLVDPNGAPVTGAHDVDVRLWDAASSWAAPRHAELLGDVPFSDGYYAIRLGASSPLSHAALDGAGLVFAVALDGGPMLAPATPIAATPTAAVAAAVPARSTSPGSCVAGGEGAVYYDTVQQQFLGCFGAAGWQPLGGTQVGESSGNPGRSCRHIHDQYPAAPTGRYWIDPNGGAVADAFEVWCEMSYSGGGWTLISQGYPVNSTAPNLCTTAAVGTLNLDGVIGGPAKLSNTTINQIWSDGTTKELLVFGDSDSATGTPVFDRKCVADFVPGYAFHTDVATNTMAHLESTTFVCEGLANTTFQNVGTSAPHCGYYFNTLDGRHLLYTGTTSYSGGACEPARSGRSWPGSTGNYGCNSWQAYVR
jgi:hypothetical protein